MKVKIKSLQAGGQAPVEDPGAQGGAPAGGASPEEQLAEMAMQIIQQLGPEASAALAQMIMQMLQEGGGGAPEAPVYAKKGGKLQKVRK